jgi:hypothetical protein
MFFDILMQWVLIESVEKNIKVGRGMVMPNSPSKEERLDYCTVFYGAMY